MMKSLYKITSIICVYFFMLSPEIAFAGSYPFQYEEVIIENPTCPSYQYEIAGKLRTGSCQQGGSKVAAGNCHYQICDTQGTCLSKDQFMGAYEVPADYTGGVAHYVYTARLWTDPDLACALIYSLETQTNTYCNLITDNEEKAYCFAQAPRDFDMYWILYYGRIILPLWVGFLLCGWYWRKPSKAVMWAVVLIHVSLLGALSNDASKMNYLYPIPYYMMIAPLLALSTFFYKKIWFNYVVIILNVIMIFIVGAMIMLLSST